MSYKRHLVQIKEAGGYILVFKRDDMKEPLAELVLFDGDRCLSSLKNFRDGINEAITMMEKDF